MRFRKLRIVWSVGCGIACVLLIVLWVRSRTQWDNFHGPLVGGHYFVVNSLDSKLSIGVGKFVGADKWGWSVVPASEPAKRLAIRDIIGEDSTYGFGFLLSTNQLIAVIPHWFPILLSGTLAALPSINHLRWHFTLRTLLIATSLGAVVLGLIVWLR
jgi:regulator of extracellular matrix RemA (YlzA/DUF370 family)